MWFGCALQTVWSLSHLQVALKDAPQHLLPGIRPNETKVKSDPRKRKQTLFHSLCSGERGRVSCTGGNGTCFNCDTIRQRHRLLSVLHVAFALPHQSDPLARQLKCTGTKVDTGVRPKTPVPHQPWRNPQCTEENISNWTQTHWAPGSEKTPSGEGTHPFGGVAVRVPQKPHPACVRHADQRQQTHDLKKHSVQTFSTLLVIQQRKLKSPNKMSCRHLHRKTQARLYTHFVVTRQISV